MIATYDVHLPHPVTSCLQDGLTFLAAACCMHRLPRSVGLPAGRHPHPAPLQLKKKHSDYLWAVELAEADGAALFQAGDPQPCSQGRTGAGATAGRLESAAAAEPPGTAGRGEDTDAGEAADRQHAAEGAGEAEPLLEHVVLTAAAAAGEPGQGEGSEGKLDTAEEDLVAVEEAGLAAEVRCRKRLWQGWQCWSGNGGKWAVSWGLCQVC